MNGDILAFFLNFMTKTERLVPCVGADDNIIIIVIIFIGTRLQLSSLLSGGHIVEHGVWHSNKTYILKQTVHADLRVNDTTAKLYFLC